MCGRPENTVLVFAVRAIAAGAGGQKLAQWAVEEHDRELEARAEAERESERLMRSLYEARQ